MSRAGFNINEKLFFINSYFKNENHKNFLEKLDSYALMLDTIMIGIDYEDLLFNKKIDYREYREKRLETLIQDLNMTVSSNKIVKEYCQVLYPLLKNENKEISYSKDNECL